MQAFKGGNREIRVDLWFWRLNQHEQDYWN
jgi:hypothetical protein